MTAFDHSGCTAKLFPPSEMFVDNGDHANLSPISDPFLSTQPLHGTGSVSASAYSWPATMEKPSK